MPTRTKKKQSNRSWGLLVLAVIMLGGIWTAEQFARASSSPGWLQTLFASTQPSTRPHVGLVAGHAGNDSGAVCPDGLTEAEVNLDITERTAQKLRDRGMTVDILDEYDARLLGYSAQAFVSLHSDSCSYDYTGFKVAHQDGAREASQRLAQCLWDSYEVVTGLPRHPQTVTPDMTQYHAFNRIAGGTPAAIIELGFLNADRLFLTQQADRAAQGVADGILCFLDAPTDP